MAAASEAGIGDRVGLDLGSVVSDHATLRVLKGRLEELLGRLVARDLSIEHEMLRLVDEFRDAVLGHFDREEESGLLAQAVDHRPQFADQVDALLREHAKIRRLIHDLCDEAPGSSWGDFEVRFDAFCQILRVHQQAENEVLMGAYLEDLGGHH